MNTTLQSIAIGTGALSVLLLVSVVLAYSRAKGVVSRPATEPVARLTLIAIALHCVHTSEEFVAGFYVQFPELLGLQPWPASFFVVFNLGWVALWALSVAALGSAARIVRVPLWFLALASVANGLAHPVFSVMAGGYFPGLYSAPVVGLVGLLLLRRLWRLGR